MPLSNASRLADFGTGIGTAGAIIQVDNANQRLGVGTTAPTATLGVAGIVSATAFYGDGSNLDGVASAGLGTALSEEEFNPLTVIYQTSDTLSVGATITVDPPDATTKVAYTQYAEIKLEGDADLIVADGDDFIPDILGLSTEGFSFSNTNGNGIFDTVYTDNIENAAGRGAPNFPLGITVSGISTLSGNVSIGGTLTYEDVTNVDSIGLITARSGIRIGAPGANILISGTGAGIGINETTPEELLDLGENNQQNIKVGQRGYLGQGYSTSATILGHSVKAMTTGTTAGGMEVTETNSGGGAPSAIRQESGIIQFHTASSGTSGATFNNERLRIGSAGQIGIAGANYGTSGQVLTSGGASAAPSWATPSGGSWELVSTTYCPDLGGTQDNIDFVGLTTAYSAYKVQFTGCTFITTGAARSQDKVLAYLRDTSNTWVTANYDHKLLRYDGGGGPDGYGQSESFMGLTHNSYVDVFSGELIIPMAFNNVNSGYGDKLFYGDFMSDRNRIMFGCLSSDANIRTTGFNGIRLQSDDHKWYEGRVSLYRLKHT